MIVNTLLQGLEKGSRSYPQYCFFFYEMLEDQWKDNTKGTRTDFYFIKEIK